VKLHTIQFFLIEFHLRNEYNVESNWRYYLFWTVGDIAYFEQLEILLILNSLLHLIYTIWLGGLCVLNVIIHCIFCHIFE